MTHPRKRRSVLLLLAAAGAVAVAAWLWTQPETALPWLARETREVPSVFGARAAGEGEGPAASRVAADAERSDDAAASEPPAVIPAFWFYVGGVRSIDDSAAQWREVRVPATALRTMPRDTLRNLGIVSLDGIAMGPVLAGRPDGAEVELWAALLDRWHGSAQRTGEDLAGAAIQFALETVGDRLWEANPPLLHLAMRMLGSFTEHDADVQRFAPALLAALRAIPPGVEPAKETTSPVLQLLAIASWPDHRGWLRRDLLGLLDAPWLTKAGVATLLMQLTSGSPWSIWAADIAWLIATGSPAAVWGAIEALRGFAATGQIAPDALVDALPPHLFEHPDTTLRWAIYELLAAFGGPTGAARLHALLDAATFPFRPEVLSFLALHGKVGTAACMALLQSPDHALRNAAIDALGHLGRTDPAGVACLSDLALGSADAEVRKLAVRSLGSCQRAEILDLLQQALADADAEVQHEAITQLGRFPEPQPERLLAAARTLTLPPQCRSLAYRELILDAPDADAGTIFRSMYDDPDAGISAEGYVWQAALAVAQRDEAGLNAWRQLPIPSHLAQEAAGNAALGALVGSVYDVRAAVVDEVQRRIEVLRSPEFRAALAQKRTREHLFGIGGRSRFSRQFAYEERILRFLGQSNGKR